MHRALVSSSNGFGRIIVDFPLLVSTPVESSNVSRFWLRKMRLANVPK